MADVTYQVLVEYMTSGNLGAQLGSASQHASHLGKIIGEAANLAGELGGHLVESFQHAVEHAGHLAGHLAKIGAAAGIGAAVYGVQHLNNELEQTQISLAAIFKAQGLQDSFAHAFEEAGSQITKMKQDIKTLPGDLGQLSNVMLQLASPLANAGKNEDQIRTMAGKTMLASQILLGAKYGSAAQEIGAREMTMLLQGNMSARNSFAMELPGMQQYKGNWKGMSEEKRAEIVQTKIDALVKDAGPAFAKSFVAGFTTLKDDFKYGFLAPATEALFQEVKKSMGALHVWFEANQTRIARFAQVVGDELVAGFNKGIELVQEWGPTVVDFAKQLRHELSIIWDRFAPALKEAGDALKGALGDGTIIKDIGKVLELYAMSKVASADSGVGKAMGSAMGGLVGGFGGAAAGGQLGSVAGVGGMTLGIPGAIAEKALEVGLVGAMKDHPKETAEALGHLAAASQRLVDMFEARIMPTLEQFVVSDIEALATGLNKLADLIEVLSHPLESFRDAVDKLDSTFGTTAVAMKGLVKFLEDHHIISRASLGAEDAETVERGGSEMHFLRTMGTTILSQNEEAKKAAARSKAPGGLGMHVQKVEIVVNQNQDPGRVAEAVMAKMQGVRLHPKVSPLAANYSVR